MLEAKRRVLESINRDEVVQTLYELVSIPGFPDFTKPSNEWEMPKINYIEHKCKEVGLDVVRCGEVPYGRFQSLIAFLRGSDRQAKVAFQAHIDTHPPLDYKLYDPLRVPRNPILGPNAALVKDGNVYGLGAGDSMPPIAAFLGAVAAIKRCNVQLKADALGIFDPAEMESGRGAQIAADWLKENGIKPEFMIVGEPNGHDVAIVQSCIYGFEIEIGGVAGYAASGSQQKTLPGFGNAFDRMIDVAQALRDWFATDSRFQVKHSLPTSGPNPSQLGAGFWFGASYAGSRFPGIGSAFAEHEPLRPGQHSRQVTTSRGGYGAHIVPEVAKLRFEIGVPPRERKQGEVFHSEPAPGLSREELEEGITDLLAKLWREKPTACTYEPLRTIRELFATPYEISAEEEHVKGFVRSVTEATGQEPKCTGLTSMCSEGAIFSEELGGMPFVSFSPMTHMYHRPDEHCGIEDLVEATRVYASAILDFCGVA